MESLERPLEEPERRWLRRAIKDARAPLQGIARRTILLMLVALGVLCAVTLVVASPEWRIALVAVWSCLSLPIGLTMYSQARGRVTESAERFTGALNRNVARVTRIQSTAVVEIEERADEGPTYAFQLSGAKIAFLGGQDFYASARFPNSDFSIVDLLGDNDAWVAMLIEKRGEKLRPLRAIPPPKGSWWPDQLQVVEGTLDDLESWFASGPPPSRN